VLGCKCGGREGLRLGLWLCLCWGGLGSLWRGSVDEDREVVVGLGGDREVVSWCWAGKGVERSPASSPPWSQRCVLSAAVA
jgi:hypothetical protein